MEQPCSTKFDARELRKVFGCFATGVAVVTTIDQQSQPRGLTVNSFTSVSLEPPLVLICVRKTAPMCEVFLNSDAFAINILARHQQSLSAQFCTPLADKFAGVNWSASLTGSPVISDVLAHLDCKRYGFIEAGDHLVLLGQVVDFASRGTEPLIFNQGAYAALAKLELQGAKL